MSDKQEIRNIYKTRRNGMSRHDTEPLSAMICDHISDSGLFRDAQYLYAYYPLGNEVDIRPVVQTAWQEGKRVAFPKVFGDEMIFFEVNGFGQLAEGAYGVMEPVEASGAVPVDWMNVTGNCGADETCRTVPSGREPGSRLLVLVPGVAFDRHGTRMGHGKGYYDRYFAEYTGYKDKGPSFDGPRSITLLGVTFDCQVAERLPAESHDLTVHNLVTEDGIILSGQSCG